MSRFFSSRHAALTPYTPGEQPLGRKYIKLNTNESPFPPSEAVCEAVAKASRSLNLYSDPQCRELNAAAAKRFGVKPENILMTNGSDEILAFAFAAFGDAARPFAFPSVSYGFYPVYSDIFHIPSRQIPLREDFTINADDYVGIGMNIVIANPNAPTGICLPLSDIERIAASNPDNVVVIDEAYIDFGGETALGLIEKYDNLIVTRTFSKSSFLAGARLGIGFACEELIADLNTIKYSTNPYNINSMTAAAGIAVLEEPEYYTSCCKIIIENRAYTTAQLEKLGFEVLPSSANFVFAAHPAIPGGELYERLRDEGILVRHFTVPEIARFNRITIGTREQMDALIAAVKKILKED